MIKNDADILTQDEVKAALNLDDGQMERLLTDGLPFIEVKGAKLFLVSSLRIYFGRMEGKRRPAYPEERR